MEAGRLGGRERSNDAEDDHVLRKRLESEKSNQPAAARRLVPLSPFPLWESRGGRVPPTQPKTAAPPTRGLRPLVNPPLYLRRELTGPAFSWKVQSQDRKGWSWMKAPKKRSSTKTWFRPGRTGACEAQLWNFTGPPGILKDDQ